MKSVKYYLVFLILILLSCENNDDSSPIPSKNEPGIVISFDDDYVDNWEETQHLLEQYNWKATFFVTKFHLLSNEKIQKLQTLKSYGHEIGAHGQNHLKATDFIFNNGADAYLEQEIYPMINLMDSNSLHASSFAYPYGARNNTTDNLLLKEYKILRGTTYGRLGPSSHNCYYSGQRVIYGLGLDNNYSHFSISYFLSLLEYAKENNKIVIFYAHKPVETAHADYETEYQTLIEICRYVQLNNMKFYTISELSDL